ncbi:DJ-1/PfpI family protein [Stecheria sp. CLA-KB-P133]|uniref:DJ-1/PfpI family protein n=1 Tax=Grylomicrobium aquisgranensis TaxID=2926318 RepID=A0AB35U6P1_9FIRM|nr:DJ-1/PfpI family protein [Stecheria sp. CLA-KB-P133]
MKKTVLILPDGCEEGEALTIADVLRRAEIDCKMCALENREVTGAWGNVIKADRVLSRADEAADMIILPGGYKGAENMCADRQLQEMLQQMNREGKIIAAICAAPLALEKAGVLKGHCYTSYPGIRDRLTDGTWRDELVVSDGNLITSQGPALAWRFAYALVQALGTDPEAVKQRMVYDKAFDEKGEQA